MVQAVHLLVFLHGVLTLQVEVVLGVSDESSDSSPGHRAGYYIFQMLPLQRREGKAEKALDLKAASLPALRPSSVWGAPEAVRPAVNMLTPVHPQPGTPAPRQTCSTQAPLPGSQALTGSALALATRSGMLQRNGDTSGPRIVGTQLAVSAGFSLTPQVLTTPGLPTKEATPSASSLTFVTKEPRGDV